MIWNNTESHQGSWTSIIEVDNGKIITVATDGYSNLSSDILFELASIESKKELIYILAEGSRVTGYEIFEIVFM